MYIKRSKNQDTGENNVFWVTMTDLMTALVLVFMVLFFYTFVTSFYDRIQGSIEQQKTVEELQESLKKKNLEITIDGFGGIVKINDLDLFDVASSELSAKGKRYLSEFAPAYFDAIFSNEYLADNIESIIIQGHTDSQGFGGNLTDDQQFMKNMELSMKRAYAVADFMVNTPYNKINGSRLRKMILVEGAGSSKPILTLDGKEDMMKSRRVELKIVMREKTQDNQPIKKIKKKEKKKLKKTSKR